jgi:cytochrome c oxidase subunit 1
MVLIMGLIIIVLNLFRSARKGPVAGKDPWGGKTLEWTIDSPPSLENFEEDVVIARGPYEYE